jgi:geranylgeranyl diphosphate synthase type II
MDKADVRRGVPTVYKKWDENTAILSGDVMSIESYRMIAKAPAAALPAVLALFSDTAAQVCEGQQYDMDFEDLPQVPMEDYLKMVGLKTAVLIACSAKMGALIAGASAREADLLYKFGYDLGLAFQIADDWLDTYGDPAVFGKAIGGDILNNKKSWLLTRALEKAGTERFAEAMAMPVSNDAEKEAKITAVKNLYAELNIEQEAKEEIIRFHNQAMGYVKELNLGLIKSEMLLRYADMLLGRRK